MIEPRVTFNDMPEERFNKMVQACRDAYKMQHDGELKYFKDMALYIKKRIEDEERGTSGWHIIIGKFWLLLIFILPSIMSLLILKPV